MENKNWPKIINEVKENKELSESEIEEIKERIKNSNQTSLKDLLQKSKLSNKILSDFSEFSFKNFENYFLKYKKSEGYENKYKNFAPLTDEQVLKKSDMSENEKKQMFEEGLKLISEGKSFLKS